MSNQPSTLWADRHAECHRCMVDTDHSSTAVLSHGLSPTSYTVIIATFFLAFRNIISSSTYSHMTRACQPAWVLEESETWPAGHIQYPRSRIPYRQREVVLPAHRLDGFCCMQVCILQLSRVHMFQGLHMLQCYRPLSAALLGYIVLTTRAEPLRRPILTRSRYRSA